MTDQLDRELIVELFEFPLRDFKDHLEIEGNSRILFSGKFGTGKSTFLHHLFFDSDLKEKYQVFHLFPVNYSVASNEDIFELIKYDVIINLLLDQNIKVEELEITNTVTLKYFLQKNPDKLIKLLLSAIPKVGKDITDFIDQISKFKKSLDEYTSKINEKTDESAMLLKHIDTLEDQTGSLYEINLVTGIIQNILARHKETNKKENVLIIDDLDRIDPDHIFRVLNIFSAHFDERFHSIHGTANKFGFDKVIVVCDIENIRRIFRNRFGQNVDFSGYIDKFFSEQPFHFQNSRQLQEFLVKHFSEFRYKISKDESAYRILRYIIGPHNTRLFIQFLITLVQHNIITIRKILSKEKRIDLKKSFYYNGIDFEFSHERHLWILQLLIQYAGGSESFLEGIKHMKTNQISLKEQHSFINVLFYIANFDQHKFMQSGSEFLIDNNREKLRIKAENDGQDTKFLIFNTDAQGAAVNERIFTDDEIYEFIYGAVRAYRQLKIIE